MRVETMDRVRAWSTRAVSLLSSDVIAWTIMLGGVALRVRQVAAHLSLGNDEAALLRSIAHASWAGLARPFPNHQSAPILFLLMQKAFITVLGNWDTVSEIFPLLAGCLAIYFFCRIARRHLGTFGLIAVLAFCLSLWLVSYSANPKQYSSDVLVTVVLIDVADRVLTGQPRRRDFLLLGMAGAFAIWLSHPSVFILPGIGLALLLRERRGQELRRLAPVAGVGLAWGAAFAVDYLVSLRNMAGDAYLQKYWQAFFMPMPPWSHSPWFLEAYRSLLLPVAGRTDVLTLLLWSALLVAGGLSLLLAKRSLAMLLLLPFALTLAASAWHKYPVWDRLLLFLAPLVYLIAAEGLRRVYLWTSPWNRAVAVAASAVLCVAILWPMAVSAKRNFFAPPHPWDMRILVEHMSRNWTTADSVFVSGGGETFQYYAESYGLRPASLTIQNSHRIVHFYLYRRELQQYAGRERVWVVFAHFEEQSFQHQRYVKYLNRVGEIQDSFQAGFARAYLCNFDP